MWTFDFFLFLSYQITIQNISGEQHTHIFKLHTYISFLYCCPSINSYIQNNTIHKGEKLTVTWLKNAEVYFVPSAEGCYLNHLRLSRPQRELNPKLWQCRYCCACTVPACTCATAEIKGPILLPRISRAILAESFCVPVWRLMLPSVWPSAYYVMQMSFQRHIQPM